MRKFVLSLAACALAATAARAQPPPQQPGPPPAEGPVVAAPVARREPLKVIPDELFDRELKDIDGRSFQLSGFRGRVFVVNLWATWCGPCRSEIPELNKLREEFRGRGVEFVGLTTEDPETDAEKVRAFAAEFGMRYRLGFADRETAVALMSGRHAIPQTLVVGPDGRVVVHFRGYSPRLPPLIRGAIEKALDPAPPADAAAPAETLAPPRP